jgi:epoxyqueuosine reductase
MENSIKEFAKSLGFDLVGITDAEPFLQDEAIALERVRNGYMDGLPWYTEERVKKMNRPTELLPGARSVISVATSYHIDESDQTGSLRGKVSRYAWGDDYHEVLKNKLRKFCSGLENIVGFPVKTRIFVDDGPMNDRAAAFRSGVGWFGKNTNILTPSHGSWVFLGQVITDISLRKDIPLKKTCGNCVRCIDDCPTGAIVSPYTIDNARCISYLTIELRGAIPMSLRPLMGDWVFGCDICQDVCPVNLKAQRANTIPFKKKSGFSAPELIPLLKMDQETFSETFRNSPIKRAKRVGLQRNACVALGNNKDPRAIPALEQAMCESEVLVRMHAAWALGQIGGEKSLISLTKALENESDKDVLVEIELAIKNCTVDTIQDASV